MNWRDILGVEPKNEPFNPPSQKSCYSQKGSFTTNTNNTNRVQKVKKINVEHIKSETIQEIDHIDLMDDMIRIPSYGFFNCKQFTDRYMEIHKHWLDGKISDGGKEFLLENILKYWHAQHIVYN